MRTTVTIDADTEHLLREEVRRTGRSFKEVLNVSLRRALGGRGREVVGVEPIFVAPFPGEFSGVSMNRVADALDDEDTLQELRR